MAGPGISAVRASVRRRRRKLELIACVRSLASSLAAEELQDGGPEGELLAFARAALGDAVSHYDRALRTGAGLVFTQDTEGWQLSLKPSNVCGLEEP